MSSQINSTRFSGWLMLVVGTICVFFAAGVNSAPAVTMPAMAEALQLDVGTISLLFTFGGIGGIISGLFLGPWIIKKVGPKKSMLIGTVGMIVNMLCLGYADNIWIIWIGAFVGGVCGVLCGVTVLAGLLGNWFVAKRSLVVGLALGFATFGSAFVQWFSGVIIPIGGYPMFYLILAICLLVFSGLCNLLFLKDRPEDVGQKALGWDLVDNASKKDEGGEKIVSGVTLKQALKSPAIYLLFIGVIAVAMAFMGFRGYGPTLLMSYGLAQPEAASYISIVSLFGGFAIMAGGVISEKLGNRAYLFVMIGGLIIALAIVALTGSAIAGMPALIVVTMLFAGTASGVSGAISSTVATEAFGTKDYAQIVVVFVAASNCGVMLYAVIVAALLNTGLDLTQCFQFFFLPCAIIGLVLLVVGLATSPAVRMAKQEK